MTLIFYQLGLKIILLESLRILLFKSFQKILNRHLRQLSFFLFRFFDITKLGPIKRFEKLPGGFGILADDLVAGLFAFLIQAAILTSLDQPLIIKTL